MRVASLKIRVLLLATLVTSCGAETAKDTAGLAVSLPEAISKETEETDTTPTTTKNTKPTRATQNAAPKTLGIEPMNAIAAGRSYTIEPTISAAETIDWLQISGPGVITFSSKTTASTTVSASVEGHYVLGVTAKDADGKSVSATVSFDWDTTPPVIGALSSVLTGNAYTLQPTVTGATHVSWSKLFGNGTLNLTAPNAASTGVTASQDGSYVLRLIASDDAGNSAIKTVNFVWDTTPPAIGSVTDIYTQSSAYLEPTVTGATGYAWTKVSGPGAITFSAPASATTIATATVEGTYVLRLTAQDPGGNTTTTDINFYRDTTPPQITAFTDVLARQTKPVTTSVVGATAYSWSKKSGPGSVTFSAPTALNTQVSALVEGAYVLTLRATDQAGNMATADVNFIWDTTPPSISAMTDIQTRVATSFSPTVTGATTYAWSKVSGPGTLSFSSASTAATGVSASVDGTYALRLTASDGAGNVATRDVNLIWDTTPPVINAMADVASRTTAPLTPTVSGAATYQWSTVSGPGTLSYDAPQQLSTNVTATVDGAYVIRLTATDDVGNSSTRDVNFIYDTVPPIVSPVSSILTNIFLSLTPTVTGATRYAWTQKSGPGSVTFTAPFAQTSNISASADGVYVITFTATDAVGNAAARDINFTWDTTAPIATLANKPASMTPSYSYNVTVGAVATDFTAYKYALIPSVALCAEATYSAGIAPATALSGTVAGEGTYILCVLAGDLAGNWQAAASATSYTWTVDATPPSIALPGSYDANATKTVAATVTGATTHQWTKTAGPGTITFSAATAASTSVTASVEGVYTLQLQSTDAAGNVATATTTFTWDVTAPTIAAMTAITTNAGFTLNPTITGATTYAWTKTAGTGTVTFGTPAAASTTVTITGDTTYTLKVVATDAAGNTSNQTVSVIYDTVAPVVAAVTAINARAAATITPAVTGGATSYAWTTVSGPGTISFGTPAANSTTASASAEGAYVLRLTATDAAGNAGFRDISFTWDTTAPTITLPSTVYAKAQTTIAPTYVGAATYAWSKTAGTGNITFTAATSAAPAVRSDTQGTFTLQVIATDLAGNAATATLQYIWDTTAPTAPVLSASVTQANGPYTITATFNETVTGLDINSTKITVGKGTVTSITPATSSSTATSYTFSITPTGTPVTFQLLAGAATDLAGNSAAASAISSLVYDSTPPVAPEAAAPTTGVLVDGIGYNTALVKWYWASDTQTTQTALKYYISYSTSSSFDSVSQVLAGTHPAAMAQSSFASLYGCYVTPTSGTTQLCTYHLTGLTASTNYYVNVVVEDAAGNQSVYTKGTFTTLGLQPVFKKIAASLNGNSTCGLAESGLVYCWGDNSVGALGDATQVAKNIPTAIDSSFKFVDITVGSNHACALRDNGNAYCWGAGADGQLGNSANAMNLSPVLVGASTDIFTALAAGDRFTCALRDDGKAACWGRNANGELANTGTSSTNAPAAINGTLLFRKISAGANHMCAIKDDGVVACWGLNFNGQLGNGLSGAGNNKTTATSVSGTTKFRDLDAGTASTCAIAGNGDLYCWGKGTSGQIGNSASSDVSVPTKVSGTDKFINVAVTTQSVCAIKDDGTLRCFGDNTNGELNTVGAQASSNTPIAATDTNRFVSISAGNAIFCGARSTGTSFCWGLNTSGQLGVGDASSRNTSTALSMTNVTAPTLVKFKKVVVGELTTCAISTTQDLWCWGNGLTTGELGVGAKIAMKTAPLHVGSSKWLDVSMAYNHACAINDAYDMYCWGKNSAYELGIASADTVARYTPTKVNGTRKYMSIATATNSSCAAATDGQLVCWGSDAGSSSGNLASGAYTALQIPTASTDISNQYVKISAGDTFYCAVTVDGLGRCWGKNSSGQLGTGNTTTQASPATFDSTNRFAAISTAAGHTCGITAALVSRCFGLGSSGQMGNGGTTASYLTAQTQTWSTTKKILAMPWGGAATDHSCVTTSDYYSYCWGANAAKQSNNSATNPITTPQMEYSNIISTSSGTTVSCQLSSQGDISCFGACDNGRCGQATPGATDAQTASGTALAVKVSGI